MRGGDVDFLVGVFGDVVEFHAAGQRRSPDEFPIALADAATERLDVVEELRAGRRFAFRDGVPDVHAVERLALGYGGAGQRGNRGINVYGVNDAIHRLWLDVAGPVGQSGDTAAAFVERTFAAAIRTIIARQFDF